MSPLDSPNITAPNRYKSESETTNIPGAVMQKKNVSALFHAHFFHNVSWCEKVFWAPVHCNMFYGRAPAKQNLFIKILNMVNIVPAKQ